MESYMHIRVTADITQDQIDRGYDVTLLSIHGKFVKWLLALELPIISYNLSWQVVDEGDDPHMIVTADLIEGASVGIDVEFFDELHLGGGT